MKTFTANESLVIDTPTEESELFVELSTGRKVFFRKMIAKDLIQLERKNKGLGDTEVTSRLIERLSVPPMAITMPEIENLSIKDFRNLGQYIAEINGLGGEDDDDDDTGK